MGRARDYMLTQTHPPTMNRLENVEHCGGEPEQADTGYYVTDG